MIVLLSRSWMGCRTRTNPSCRLRPQIRARLRTQVRTTLLQLYCTPEDLITILKVKHSWRS